MDADKQEEIIVSVLRSILLRDRPCRYFYGFKMRGLLC